jgi:hypothetical protein
MNFFLRLKHWQLFLLLIGVPLVLQIIFVSVVVASNDPFAAMMFFPVIMIIVLCTFFGWLYSVGAAMHKKIPFSMRPNLGRFKLFMLVPTVYISCICVFLAFIARATPTLSGPGAGIMVLIILPLHLFSMFCIFYCLYFAAKTLKMAELQRPLSFGDFAGEFFLMWFFPIGIWILQPRINYLAAREDDAEHLPEGQIFPE